MNTTDERDQFLEEIRHKKRVLQSEKGRLDAAKRTYKGAQDKQVIIDQKIGKYRYFSQNRLKFYSLSARKFW